MATITSALPSATASTAPANPTAVADQAGVLEGANPTHYSASNPILLFIIQAGIVIILCQLLHYPLRLLRQPRVIAEVIAGILLGPSVFMRVPGFQNAIFPTASMPVFNNVANLGLIIFLFLVGLEVDVRLFTSNWRAALSVGLASMLLPFALGYALAWGLYHDFADPGTVTISFGVYGLFIGTALAITAFPVLCRILTELKLLRTGVGVTVLAAGIGNDVTGWVLLALCVALVKNSSGLAALWALLCCIAWVIFLVFAVRPPFVWLLKRTGSLRNGPTQGMVALTLLLALTSSFFTGIIGIHPIFGAFLAGLICPHDGGFAVQMTNKIEDLISVLFLPLYFASSGLSTDLGLLDDGKTWGYVIAVIVCAFAGKIIGGTLAARANKLLWRESLVIGCLMSCKGLVEIIVLNIGLQANILSQRTFTMFVVMALVTTVSTTPLTTALYPPWYQKKIEKWRRGEIDWDGNPTEGISSSQEAPLEKLHAGQDVRRLMVYLRLDSLPSIFSLIGLLGNQTHVEAAKTDRADNTAVMKKPPMEVHGLRVVELTERTSSVMQVTEGEEAFSLRDPVVGAFRTFAQLNDLAVSGRVAVVPEDSYAETLVSQASDLAADFALVPWSENGNVVEDQLLPFSVDTSDRFKSPVHLEFMHAMLQKAARVCDTGIFIDNGFGGITKPVDRPGLRHTLSALSLRSHVQQVEATAFPVPDKSHHIFFPFLGGPDDRAALRFVLQLAQNRLITATIKVYTPGHRGDGSSGHEEAGDVVPSAAGTASATAFGAKTIPTTTMSDFTASDQSLLATLQSSLPSELVGRVSFKEVSLAESIPSSVLRDVLAASQEAVGQAPRNAGDVVVVGRQHAHLGDAVGFETPAGYDLKTTVGAVAEQMVAKGVKASLLVIQAGIKGTREPSTSSG